MAVNYIVQASVVDIRSDIPIPSDSFFVDTNVWYWMTYNRASHAARPPMKYQIESYPDYIAKAITINSKLNQCGLSLAELAHIIERTEHEIFNNSQAVKVSTKEYRHNTQLERDKVVSEIRAAWGQVATMSSIIETNIDNDAICDLLIKLQNHPLDGYDLYMLDTIQRSGIMQIITDDGDFATVPNIQLFTANYNVLTAASKQGKLVKR